MRATFAVVATVCGLDPNSALAQLLRERSLRSNNPVPCKTQMSESGLANAYMKGEYISVEISSCSSFFVSLNLHQS